jgi:hypothetical protein
LINSTLSTETKENIKRIDISDEFNVKLTEVKKIIDMEGINKLTQQTLNTPAVSQTRNFTKDKEWIKNWLTKNNG